MSAAPIPELCVTGECFVSGARHALHMRTAYRCRACPDPAQQAVLNRTFGCVRKVWNTTLEARQQRYATGHTTTSYAQTDRALTAMKKNPDLAFLNEVSSVPLQQTLRHQHQAFTAFFAKRTRYPRFKSRHARQSARYTRSAFTLRGRELRLAKTNGPLRFVWSWPDIDITGLNPTMVVVSREPDARWYVTFAVDTKAPEPLSPAGRAVGVDLGITDFAVTSDGNKTPTRATWNARHATWPATSGGWPAVRKDRRTGPKPKPRSPAPTARSATPATTSCTAPAPTWSATTT